MYNYKNVVIVSFILFMISEKYGIVSEFRGKSSGDSQSGSSTDLDSKEHQQVIVQDHYARKNI